MKNKSLIFITLFFTAIIAVSFFNSCSKEEESSVRKTESNLKLTDVDYAFEKDIQLFDKSGENSVIMRVLSNDKALLELYSSHNFEVIPIKNGQRLDDALLQCYGEAYLSGEEEDGELDIETDISDEYNSTLAFQIISQDLVKGVKNIAINYLHPDDNVKAKWRYYTHYSYKDFVTITRVSFWRRVYCGIYYQESSSSSTWSTLVGAWYKLSNNEQVYKGEVGSYRLKARIKTKKSSAYTIEFEN